MSLPTPEEFERLLTFACEAHRHAPCGQERPRRRACGDLPTAARPVWCATAILSEPNLPPDIRECGWQALLLCDVPDPAATPLPHFLSDGVRTALREMHFESEEAEWREIWSRPRRARLYTLYREVHGYVAQCARRNRMHDAHVLRLTDAVDGEWGDVSVVRLAFALAS